MLAKNIVGICIVVLNLTGLCYVFYAAGLEILDYFASREEETQSSQIPAHKNEKVVIDENIIPDGEDLLKDMDLSDLDNLDLDDFE